MLRILITTRTVMRRDDTTQRMLLAPARMGPNPIISEQGTEVVCEFGANMCSVKTGSRVQEVSALALRGGGGHEGKWDKNAQQQWCVVT